MIFFKRFSFSLLVILPAIAGVRGRNELPDRIQANPMVKAMSNMSADEAHAFFELLDMDGDGRLSEHDIRAAAASALAVESEDMKDGMGRQHAAELNTSSEASWPQASSPQASIPATQMNFTATWRGDYLETSAPFCDFAPQNAEQHYTRWVQERDALPRRKKTETQRLCSQSVYSELRILWLMDFFPKKLQGGGSLRNIGEKDDPSYIWLNAKKIKDGAVLGILPRDMPMFIENIFSKLPKSARITVVNTHDDWSNPIEIFTGGARKWHPGFMEVAWGSEKESRQARLKRLSDFIEDPRLKHWYIQNYDLLGCGFWTNSELYQGYNATDLVFKKVSPIPIGSGLYAAECRKDDGDDVALRELGAFKPWAHREGKVFGGGESMKSNDQKLSRNKMNDALSKAPTRLMFNKIKMTGNSDITGMPKAVKMYFETISKAQFAIAPHGNGQDTHRIWEVLMLGTVPVVLTSALDLLYSAFPIVVIDDPKELLEHDFVTKWSSRLRKRWGPEPVSIEVRKRLRVLWWEEKVRSGTPTAGEANIDAFVSGSAVRANAWPICSIPSCKPERLDDAKGQAACENEVVQRNKVQEKGKGHGKGGESSRAQLKI